MRSTKRSAAFLTWNYLFPKIADSNVPQAIKLVDDYDRWVFNYEHSDEFRLGMLLMSGESPENITFWKKLLEVRKDVGKALEITRGDKKIGNSLEAKVIIIPVNEMQAEFLKENKENLADLFIVSQVELAGDIEKYKENTQNTIHQGLETGAKVVVTTATGKKCDRCWKYSETVGLDKEHPDLCERCLNVVRG